MDTRSAITPPNTTPITRTLTTTHPSQSTNPEMKHWRVKTNNEGIPNEYYSYCYTTFLLLYLPPHHILRQTSFPFQLFTISGRLQQPCYTQPTNTYSLLSVPSKAITVARADYSRITDPLSQCHHRRKDFYVYGGVLKVYPHKSFLTFYHLYPSILLSIPLLYPILSYSSYPILSFSFIYIPITSTRVSLRHSTSHAADSDAIMSLQVQLLPRLQLLQQSQPRAQAQI
jgi:hypothetical protein